MLKITNILNPLTGGSTTTEYEWEKGKPLSEYIGYEGECVVAHNNSIIDLPVNQIMPARRDEYMVMPIPAGGDRQSWRIFGQAFLGTVAMIFPSPITAGIYIFGSNLLNIYLADKNEDQSTSPSYSWQHRSSPTAARGVAMPVIYGKVRMRPVLKNRYVEVRGDKQYLYALYSLAAHKVDETTHRRFFMSTEYDAGDIVRTPLDADEPGKTYRAKKGNWRISYLDTDYWEVWHGTASFAEDILVNGVAINSFMDNVTWETRPGFAQQAIIEGFDVTYVNTAYNQLLTTPGFEATFTTFSPSGNVTQNIEVILSFPNGLYSENNAGKTDWDAVFIAAQYRKLGDTDWINFELDKQGVGGDSESKFDATSYALGNYAGGATTEVLWGHLIRKTTKIFYFTLKALSNSYLEEGQYQIRLSVVGDDDTYLLNIGCMTYGEANADGTRPGFTYPGEPLLGIKTLASGQISGDLDVQVDVERSKVWVWNINQPGANKWVQGDANNHAWAVYDILVNGYYNSDTDLCHPAYPYMGNEDGEAIYGCGVNPTHIDYESFKEWAANIETLNYSLNIVFDTFMTAWDAILRICQEGRGIVYPVGTTIFAMAYKKRDPVQLFTMGNIHMDTFTQKYTESRQKANMLEVKYWDKERNYEETILSVRTADWDSDASLNKPSSMTLYGTVDYDQAATIARFTLLINELLKNIIVFGVDIDALASQVGDVVSVSHDILGTGNSGRVVSYTDLSGPTNSVTLDRTVTSVSGYILKIRHADGTIESKATDTTGSVATLHFATAWTTEPALHDVYSFGATTATNVQEYHIVEISRTNELMRTLTLMQYDGDVHVSMAENDNEGEFTSSKIIPTSASVGEKADLLNLAYNVKLQEIITRNNVTGEYESSIVVTFDSAPPPASRGKWEIHLRDVDVSDINWKGTWVDDDVYNTREKVELGGVTYISTEDSNATRPFSIVRG